MIMNPIPEAGAVVRDVETLAAQFAAHGYPPPHPLALCLPSDDSVGHSITTAHDVVVPVIVRRQTGEIVDGIIRCERLCRKGVPWSEVPKRVLDLPTDEAVANCIAKSLDRRHLDQSQMAIVAVQLGLAVPRQGARTDLGQNCRKLQTVCPKYLQYARTVMDPRQGSVELATAVMSKEITVADAAKITQYLTKEQQAAIYRDSRDGGSSFKTVAENAINAERSRRLSGQCAPFPTLVAPVVYLDPPWPRDGESPLKPRDTIAHYPTTLIEDICNLPVRNVLARHGWLFMWATVQHRQKALSEVVPAYDCEFVDEIIWRKNTRGLGRVVRHMHEILLVCRRGNPPLPPTNSIPDSVVEADVEEHSKKPDIFRDIIISMTPNLKPRLELFARGKPYPGLVAWGNEVAHPGKAREAAEFKDHLAA